MRKVLSTLSLFLIIFFSGHSWAKKGVTNFTYFSYAKTFNSTEIGIGYATGVITRGGNIFEGSSWRLGFPLNSCLRTVFSLKCLKLKHAPVSTKYYSGKGGLILHFSPNGRADPYIELGLIGDKKEVTGTLPKGGIGWYGGMGMEFLLSRYASLILFGGYLKDGVFKDDAFMASVTLNTCYKHMCAMFKGEFSSKRDFWESSETLTIQTSLQIRFNVIKLIEEVKEVLGSDSWSL